MSLSTDSIPTGPKSTGPSSLLAVLVILTVGLLCYGVGLGVAELDKEEARRAIPAREMLASGEFILPTVWQRTYLAKPPLMFWTIAAVADQRGQVDELATRIPSAIATLLTALLLFAFGRRVLGQRTGFVAALVFLVSPGVFEKGALGELEATLALYVFAASACLWLALEEGATRAVRNTYTILASIALAAAMMTKGPVALLFFGGAIIGVAVAHRSARLILRPACWLPVLAALIAIGSWAAMVMQRVDSEHALDVWTSEMSRAQDLGIGNYFKDRRKLALGVLAAFFPGSWLCLIALFSRRRDPSPTTTAGKTALVRFLAIALIASLTFFLLQPGVRTRFCYPALPWCSLLGAHVLVQAMAMGRARWLIGAMLILIALVGTALVLGAIVVHFTPIQGIEPFGMQGHLLIAILAAAVIWTFRQLRKPTTNRLLLGALIILVGARLVQTTQLEPQLEASRPKTAFGKQLDQLVPEGESIDLRFWFGFNELSYTQRHLVFSEPSAPIGAHRFILTVTNQVKELRANTEQELVKVGDLQLVRGTALSLLEVR